MAVPKKKVSKTKRNHRHSAWQRKILKSLVQKATTTKCSNCWEVKLSYRVCPECGYYNWKQVLNIKSKTKEEIIEE